MTTTSLLTPTIITKEALRIFHNTCKFAGLIDMQYSDQFAQTGAKIGSTINIRKPNQFTVSTGPNLDIQGITETSVPLTIDTQAHVDFKFDTVDLTLTIDEYSDRYLKPAVTRLASYVDYQCTGMYADVFNAVGTFGTSPTDVAGFMAAKQKLQEYAAPEDDQVYQVLDPATMTKGVVAMSGLFQSANLISEQYKSGKMGQALGLNWYMDQNVRKHTMGTWTGTPRVKTTVSTEGSTTIVTENWGAPGNTITAGTIFTVGSVNAVNPENKQDLGYVQQFVVTAAATVDSSSEASLSVYPPMYTSASGGLQTITAFPVATATMTFRGTTAASKTENLVFHKSAFALATVDLEMPKGLDFASRQVMDGISMRILRQYDINTDVVPCRIDVLFGKKAVRPEWACRVPGA